MKRFYILLFIFLLMLIVNTSCSKEKEVSVPNIEVDSVQSIEITGSGVNYDIAISNSEIIDSILDWYDNISEIKEEGYHNTFIYDPLLKLRLSDEKIIVIQADDLHEDLIQVTHIIGNGKGSTQVAYHGRSESISEFIINLRKLKEENNNQSPTEEDIIKIISEININNSK